MLVLGESSWERPPYLKRIFGIGGEITELFQNLNACLRVSRFDRAENIVRLISTMGGTTAPERTLAHTIYLRALVEELEAIEATRPHIMVRAQKWFERELKPTCRPSGDIYALMCQVALAVQVGPQRDRTLRRYLVQANTDGLYEETLDSDELTDAQADMLEQVYSGRSADRLLAESVPQPAGPELSTLSSHRHSTGTAFEILPVEQKGHGLDTLKASLHRLETFQDVEFPHYEALTSKQKELEWARRRQEAIERSVADEALKRWRQENEQMMKMGIAPVLETRSMSALLWEWHKALEPRIEKELEEYRDDLASGRPHPKDSLPSQRMRWGTYMEAIPIEQLSALTIVSTLRTITALGAGEPVKTSMISTQLGKLLEQEYLLRRNLGKKSKSRFRTRAPLAKTRSSTSALSGELQPTSEPVASFKQYMIPGLAEAWPLEAKYWIATFLMSKLLEVANISVPIKDGKESSNDAVTEPAMKHEIIYNKGRRLGVVTAHDKLVQMLQKEPLKALLGASLPMVVPPKPWTGYNKGGFLTRPTEVIRAKENNDTQKLYTMAAAERGNMAQVFEALNVLGKVPWRINQDVFKVMVEAWNTGEGIADIAPLNPDLPYPPEPVDKEDLVARAMWLRRKTEIDNKKNGLHSERCYQNFQMEIARAYLDETFYCPHNVDFRGRVYPLPPYLNHMGADFARGLMIFAKGKPLGEEGLRWLKIHLANVFGYDKASLQEREDFVVQHMDDIRDAVNNPITGRRWWLKADDPWQCLATCFELKNAMDLPIPEQFISHMPVHQDGTCNGLQHYAALGGDTAGAQQVNLEPGDRPADIYTAVARLVIANIAKDAEAGDALALKLEGKITRKVVKQTVMTNVYGVTFIGARAQVNKQLDELMEDDTEEPALSNYRLSIYIVQNIFAALGSMFTGAQNIQRWLGQCADRISMTITPEQLELMARRQAGENPEVIGPKISTKLRKYVAHSTKPSKLTDELRSCVVWTTPLNMPVVQPYRSASLRRIQTTLQNVAIREPSTHDPVAKRKQLQAFPPNFIHSLDATHMMLSALKCDELGLTFASVHDSFWTHAADIPVMSKVLRDAFVLMHSEDIVGRLAAEFKARYKNCLHYCYIDCRTPAGKAIAQLRKDRRRAAKLNIDTKASMAELLEEHMRQKLLRSKDPEERKKGKEMITPASIVESSESTEGVTSSKLPTSYFATGLGLIPKNVSDAISVEEPVDNHEEEVEDPEDDESSGTKAKTTPRPADKHTARVGAWLPLKFPDVPAKGDFDVRRLKESQYFFS